MKRKTFISRNPNYRKMKTWQQVLAADHKKEPDPNRLESLPPHLRGLPSNRYGGQNMTRLRAFRGAKYGAAGPVRQIVGDEKEAIIRELKEQGIVQ